MKNLRSTEGPQILTAFGSHLQGYLFVCADGTVAVPFIQTKPERSGHCGAFLDQLPKDRAVIVPCCLSHVLAEMLERRGFQRCAWWNDDCDEWDPDAWVRLAAGVLELPTELGGSAIEFEP